MTRTYFDKQLCKLNDRLLKMAKLVEIAIDKSTLALINKDINLASEVYRGDIEINELERNIEKKCIVLIATQQPMATDLRTIGTALKIITDLERIADHAVDISEITYRIIEKSYIKSLIDIPFMAKISNEMLRNSIEAYVNRDIKLAEKTWLRDDEVDKLFYTMIIKIEEIMKIDSIYVEQAVDLLLIAKYFERIADHATNICEWVIYLITGDRRKMGNPNKKENIDPLKRYEINRERIREEIQNFIQ